MPAPPPLRCAPGLVLALARLSGPRAGALLGVGPLSGIRKSLRTRRATGKLSEVGADPGCFGGNGAGGGWGRTAAVPVWYSRHVARCLPGLRGTFCSKQS